MTANENSFESLLSRALAQPSQTLRLLDQLKAEDRLEDFVVQGWSILEPGTTLKRGWTLGAVCEHLEGITYGHIDRLLMNVPPGFMKSMLTNVFWPMWEWGPRNFAHLRYVCFSYSSSLTERDNDRCRHLLHSQWYKEAWGERFHLTKDNTTKFINSRQGFKLATSVGGVGTGERGNRVLVDDPHNVKDGESEAIRTGTTNWFREVLPSRLNDAEKDVIMVIMQRVHAKDVSGIILAQDHGYTHLNIPMEFEPERKCYSIIRPKFMQVDPTPLRMKYIGARHRWYSEDATLYIPNEGEDALPPSEMRVESKDLEAFEKAEVREVFPFDPRSSEGELAWPERFPQKVIDRDKRMMGEFAWAGQMQQRPEPREGAMFKRHWFNFEKAWPAGTRFCSGWDLAGTGEEEGGEPAYTARVVVGKQPNGRFIIAHADRMRGSAGKVETYLKVTSSQDQSKYQQLLISLPQDPGQAGKGQARSLCALLAGYTVRATLESGDKITRAEASAAQAEVGNIDILEGDWNEEFLDELCSFPFGAFKDQTDAFTRAFNELNAAPEAPRVRRL